MPKVLTTASEVGCGKQGKANPRGESKLTVNGSPVLTKGGVAGQAISSCGTVTNTSGMKQCTTVAAVATGEATKLKVGGQAVLLDSLTGTTDGTGEPGSPLPPASPLKASAGQSKLTAS
jgi:hypothetical protein